MVLTIPPRLAATCRNSAGSAAWLAGLPATIQDLQSRWALTLEPPFSGPDVTCAWVAPAMMPDGTAAVLKLGMPHMEGEHEIDGLRFWNGDPAVNLLDCDDRLGAMLLERCEPGTTLRSLPEPDQDVVIARLLQRLWRPPVLPHPFRPLSALIAHWSKETLAAAAQWPDVGLVREGLQLLAELSGASAADVLLATDLHAGNVLQARREPWLVIDPKPFVGDPAYDATQHLFNCRARLHSDPEGTIARFSDLLSLPQKRIRHWVFARAAADPRDDWGDDEMLELARRIAP